jgi:hypothetical protein
LQARLSRADGLVRNSSLCKRLIFPTDRLFCHKSLLPIKFFTDVIHLTGDKTTLSQVTAAFSLMAYFVSVRELLAIIRSIEELPEITL